MTSKQATHANILLSIIIATAIIMAAIVIDDKENSQMVFFILIAIWFVPFSYLNDVKNRRG